MNDDSALFEDDFENEFAAELEGLVEQAEQLPPLEEGNPLPADLPVDDAEGAASASFDNQLVAEVEDQVIDAGLGYLPEPDGGDRPVPAISVRAFFENSSTAELLEHVAADRRMQRADVDAQPGGLDAAIEYLMSNVTPNLLVVESALPAAEMLAKVDQLAEHCDPGVQVMVIGATNDIALYRQLMARGVSEYVVPPVRPVQLIRTISGLFADPETPFLGRSIAIVGAKGGVGASTIAHNLAWSLAENAGQNTTLVDLDLSFGTTALDFNQEGAQTVMDALLTPERTDEAVISRLLTQATERLSLFTAPASVNEEVDIQPEAYDIVVQAVRRSVPYVVLDLPHVWNGWLKDTLVAADDVVIVCQPDLASLRNGKNIIDRLKAERANDAPPKLILNMVGVPKRPEIPVKDFAAALDLEPEVILPFDAALFGAASNNGQMISETQSDSKASLAIDHLASVLTGQSVEVPQKSLLQKLLGK